MKKANWKGKLSLKKVILTKFESGSIVGGASAWRHCQPTFTNGCQTLVLTLCTGAMSGCDVCNPG